MPDTLVAKEAASPAHGTRYHRIFNASPLPTWISDARTGRVLDVNDAALRAYGYSREEFLAISVSALRRTGASANDREHRRKDGTRLAVRLQVVALDLDGVPAHLTVSLGIAPTHAAFALREMRLIEALELAQVGSWEWNAVTGEGTWSRELYRLYGAPSSVVPGLEEFLSRVHPDDRPRVSQTIADETARQQERFDLECRIVLPDGSLRRLFNRHVATYDAWGRTLTIRGTAQEITAQR